MLMLPIFSSSLSLRERTEFTRELYLLLKAQLPLLEALETLSEERLPPPLKKALLKIMASLKEGNSFSDSLAEYPSLFPSHYIALIRIGEKSAYLPQLLQELLRLQEAELQLQRTLQSAMIYPLLVLSSAFILVGLLMTFVIPQFQELFYESFEGAPLPQLTQWLLKISALIHHHALLLTLFLLLTFFLLTGLQHSRYKSVLADYWERFLLKVPIPFLSSLYQKSLIAQLSQILGGLLMQGIPILEAIELTHQSLSSPQATIALQELSIGLQKGNRLTTTLKEHPIFPPMVLSMIRVGEKTGNLASLLLQISELYREESHEQSRRLMKLIEPITILLLALIVGGVVIALFLPLTSMIDQLSMEGMG